MWDDFGFDLGVGADYWDFGGATVGDLPLAEQYFGMPLVDTPIIDFSTTQGAGAGLDGLFFQPSDGSIVDGSGNMVMTSAQFAEAERALSDVEIAALRDQGLTTDTAGFEAANPGLLDRLGAAMAPISQAMGTPLGRTLTLLGLGGVGTAIGALAAGSGPSAAESLKRLGGGPALPPSIAAGNAAVQTALGTGAGMVPPAGVATGQQNLEEAVRQAIIGQRLGAEYYAGMLGREAGAEAMEAPALMALRQNAIASLPSTALVGPQDRSALMNPLIARSRDLLLGGPETYHDPVRDALRGQAMELLAPGAGQPAGTQRLVATQTPRELTPAESKRLTIIAQIRQNMAENGWAGDTGVEGARLLLSSVPGISPAEGMRIARSMMAGQYVDPTERPQFTTSLTPSGTVAQPGAPGTAGTPGANPATMAGGRPISDTSPLDDSIQAGLGAELGRAFAGQIANPDMEREIEQGRETLRNQLMQQLATTTPELTTAGAQRLAEYDFRARAMREQDRRAIIASYAPMEQSRRQFNIAYPESRYLSRLSTILPQEAQRSQFAYTAPRNFYAQQLGTLIPQTLSAEQMGQTNRARRFNETSSLMNLGRTNTGAALTGAESIFPVSSITSPQTAAQNNQTGYQALIASASAAERERNARASGISNLFTTAGTVGLGLGSQGDYLRRAY